MNSHSPMDSEPDLGRLGIGDIHAVAAPGPDGTVEEPYDDMQEDMDEMEDGEGEDEEEEDDGEDDEESVLLGFVQQPSVPWALARHHFPSKVGGTPAWLDPDNLPRGQQTLCGICEKPLEYLLQVYAPVEEEPSAFHRTLFLFVCRSLACLQQDIQQLARRASEKEREEVCRSVKVFRSQLRRANSFYSSSPPQNEAGAAKTAGATLCSWCATWRAEKRCGGCRQTQYCCRDHQVAHWRGGHASICRQVQAAAAQSADAAASTRGTSGEGASAAQKETTSPGAKGPVTAGAPEESGSMAVDAVGARSGETRDGARPIGELDGVGLSGPSKGEAARQVAATPSSAPAGSSGETMPGTGRAANPKSWPEFELRVEDEAEAETDDDEGSAEQNGGRDSGLSGEAKRLLREYEQRKRAEGDYSAEEMRGIDEEKSPEQRHWVEFQARVAAAPQQVLRYCRGERAKPLWPKLGGEPSRGDIPACHNCGGERIFELQVLPQVLYYLKVDSSDSDALDFGTLVVYTCKSSCDLPRTSPGYIQEFVWIQSTPE